MESEFIGALRHRVELEAMNPVGDGAGGVAHNWTKVAEFWAKITPRGATENVDADRISSAVTHEITVRYRDDIKPEMRLRLGSRILSILGIVDIGERRRFLKLNCSERGL